MDSLPTKYMRDNRLMLPDALGAVRLKDVSFFVVVEAVQSKAAFKAHVDLAHVIPEVLETGDRFLRIAFGRRAARKS